MADAFFLKKMVDCHYNLAKASADISFSSHANSKVSIRISVVVVSFNLWNIIIFFL